MPRNSSFLISGLIVLLGINLALPAWLIRFDFVSSKPSSFYSHQTDALLAGQLHLKLAPHPQLAKLSNPYLGEQNRNYRILDLSYYKGKYYSYFGVGAVVLLTIPWKLLTGNFLTEPGATVLLAWFSSGFSLLALWNLRSRLRHKISDTEFLAAYLLVSLGNYGTIHFIGTNGGTVAQYGAYLGLNAAIAFLTGRRVLWKLGAASLCCAVAVSCRPSILPATAILLPFVFVFWKTNRSQKGFLRIAGVTAMPFVAVVIGLLYYNYLRFDHPLEFGNRLQLTDYDYRTIPAFSLDYFYHHFFSFLTAPLEFRHFFPFFLSRRDVVAVGLLCLCPASWAALAGLAVFTRRGVYDLEIGALFWGALIAFAGVFLFLAAYVVFLFHYEIDFIHLWNWVTVVGWFSLLLSVRGPAKSAIKALGFLTIGATAAMAFLYTLSTTDYRARCPRLEYAFNSIVARIDNARGIHYGPISLDVTFPRGTNGKFPIVASGLDHNDLVYAQVENGFLRFAFFHAGIGGPVGDPIVFDDTKAHHIELFLGPLLPPENHPYFKHWDPFDVVRAKTGLAVTLDGKRALRASVEFYPSEPRDVLLGLNPALAGIADAKFAGEILSSSQTSVTTADKPSWPEVRTGAAELTFRLSPHLRSDVTEPILSTGVPGNGDLVFIRYLPDSTVQFGLDHWGQAFTSKPLPLKVDAEHTLTLRYVALADGATSDKPLEIYCDDKPVLNPGVTVHPSSSRQVFYGYNAIGSTVSTPMFSGTISHVLPIVILKPGTNATLPRPGVVSLKAILQSKIYKRGQPLIVCGKTGAADMVYLRLEDDHHLTLGFDHWGTGGAVSNNIEFDPQVTHRIDVELGGIRALDDNYTGPKDQYVVWLDGVEVLKGNAPFYPADLAHVYLGSNPVGASTADASFDGELMYLDTSPQ